MKSFHFFNYQKNVQITHALLVFTINKNPKLCLILLTAECVCLSLLFVEWTDKLAQICSTNARAARCYGLLYFYFPSSISLINRKSQTVRTGKDVRCSAAQANLAMRRLFLYSFLRLDIIIASFLRPYDSTLFFLVVSSCHPAAELWMVKNCSTVGLPWAFERATRCSWFLHYRDHVAQYQISKTFAWFSECDAAAKKPTQHDFQ